MEGQDRIARVGGASLRIIGLLPFLLSRQRVSILLEDTWHKTTLLFGATFNIIFRVEKSICLKSRNVPLLDKYQDETSSRITGDSCWNVASNTGIERKTGTSLDCPQGRIDTQIVWNETITVFSSALCAVSVRVLATIYVNLIQARVTWEEETSAEKVSPPDWLVGKPVERLW